MRKLKIGTRESRLAIAQTRIVIDKVRERYPDLELEMVTIKTSGDLILDRALDQVGGKGLFIKEIELALLQGTIDLAVHSMKDLPVQIAPGLTIAAISEREDPRDALVSRAGATLAELPAGAVVGTSSLRRSKQLLALRPDLTIRLLRGNIVTRLDKLAQRQYDAIILAAAGLKRLGLQDRITQYFTVEEMIPAVCQGFLAIETRRDDDADFLKEVVHCEHGAVCAGAERGFLIRLNGGCSVPMGAHAATDGDCLKITGMLAANDRPEIYRETVAGPVAQGKALGERLAEQILARSGGVR